MMMKGKNTTSGFLRELSRTSEFFSREWWQNPLYDANVLFGTCYIMTTHLLPNAMEKLLLTQQAHSMLRCVFCCVHRPY